MSEYHCESCGGSRLNKESTSYKVGENNIKELSSMDISNFYLWVTSVKKDLNEQQKKAVVNVDGACLILAGAGT